KKPAKKTSEKKPAKKPAEKKPTKKPAETGPVVKQPVQKPPTKTSTKREGGTAPEIPPSQSLSNLPGVGEKLQLRLHESGYYTIDQISRARAESLCKKVEGLAMQSAVRLIQSAKSYMSHLASESPPDEAAESPVETSLESTLKSIPGIGPKLELKLREAGYSSVPRLSRSHPESLAATIDGLSVQKAREIVEAAKEVVRRQQMDTVMERITPPAAQVTEEKKDVEKRPVPETESKPERRDDKASKSSASVLTVGPSSRAPSTAARMKSGVKSRVPKAEKPKPKRTKSNLPVPEPVLELQEEMKLKWTSPSAAAQIPQVQETVEVVNLDSRETMELLVQEAIEILNETMTTGRPAFEIPSRSSENIVWDEVRDLLLLGMKTVSRPYHSLASVVDATRTARVMEIVFQLLRANLHATKREIYYSDVNLFRDQKYSDKIIEDVASMLSTTRDSVHVVASARGSAMGRVLIRDGGDTIDLTKMGTGGWAITPFLDQVEIIESDAEFILLSEKDAAVMRLAEAKYWNRQPCIVITGKGSGDMATRMFLKRLVKELEIPAFALVDSDPYGHYIYSVFLRGSKRLSYESPFIATPELKLLGVLSRDLDEYNIPKSVRIPMEPADVKRVKDMLKEPFVKANNRWVDDLELMLRIKEKAEIQAFASHSFEYLVDEYLPRKLETGDWI
ncbi:MAG: hypothetical protein HXY34_03315, partial [Candidatus Thorarchaeota archaeon]|nr:hypothetical protein [Candidatus Thorarchaeota archaeon]